ncbi:MAG: hypothetical protein IJH20_05675 [Bacilli bacterium]|nr:hypothetical protein [Bacilli bacterium]
MIYETIFDILYLIGGLKKNEVTNFQYFSFTFIGSFVVAVIALAYYGSYYWKKAI